MKIATMSNSKGEQHSKKDCICGSHSANDRTKNKNHNNTRTKLGRRKTRKFFKKLSNSMFENSEPLSGKYLDYLDECMMKSAKNKPTDFFSK